MRLLISIVSLTMFLPICVLAADRELSVPVRVLGSAPRPQREAMQSRPEPAQEPTITRGLLPQYQDSSAFQSDVSQPPDPDKSAMRFVVALPDRLLLLEASVTIDGKPFEMIREQRIDRLIADLKNVLAQEPKSTSTETQADESTTVAAVGDESAGAAESKDKLAAEPNDEQETDEQTGESEPEVELNPVPSSALEARLRRYATVTGRPPTRDEVRWLLTKWFDGPTLLLLDENFQRFRATQAPVFQVLDRDMDGKVSEKELKAAEETLLSCDVNQNDVVEYTEIAAVADDPRRKDQVAPTYALIAILEAPAVARAFRRLGKRYASPDKLKRFDTNSDGEMDAAEIANLDQIAPDIAVNISFDSQDATKSTTRILHISSDLRGANQLRDSLGPWITIPVGGTLVEFSAVQSAGLSGSDQISVGLVNDGYPMLPAIDPNEDGRLTIRELRRVLHDLQRFDVNKDGVISQDEIPSTVRVSFGLGPSVHQHLADIRSVHPPSTVPKIDAPDWFEQMDANKDGDISPREFLLGPDKFKQLDADNDGLVSPQEAIDLTGNKPKETSNSKPEEAKASS